MRLNDDNKTVGAMDVLFQESVKLLAARREKELRY